MPAGRRGVVVKVRDWGRVVVVEVVGVVHLVFCRVVVRGEVEEGDRIAGATATARAVVDCKRARRRVWRRGVWRDIVKRADWWILRLSSNSSKSGQNANTSSDRSLGEVEVG